jgi:chorismate dehydratase
MEKVEKVILDYQSKTSVNLARILLKEYWKKDVVLIDATSEDYRKEIGGTTAGVVIGDRALEQRLHSNYIYDLGEAWKAHTGLPFVFAAWISNKKLPREFVQKFNEANSYGFLHLDKIVAQNPSPHFDLMEYFTTYINYDFDDRKREALTLFLKKISAYSARVS